MTAVRRKSEEKRTPGSTKDIKKKENVLEKRKGKTMKLIGRKRLKSWLNWRRNGLKRGEN